MARGAVILLLAVAPLVYSGELRDGFRLPKLLLSENLALLSLLLLAVDALLRPTAVAGEGALRWLRRVARAPAVLALGPLWVVSGLTLLVSGGGAGGWRVWWSSTIAFVAVVVWGRAFPRADRLLRWTVAAASVLTAVLFLQAFTGADPLGVGAYGRVRLGALIGNTGELGAYLVLPALVSLGAALAVWRDHEPPTRSLAWCLGALAFGVGVALTRTLAAMAALAAGLVAFAILAAVAQRRARGGTGSFRLPWWRLAGGAALALVALVVLTPVELRVERKLAEIRHGDLNRVLTGRLDGWRTGVSMAREEPLLGVGWGRYGEHFTPVKERLMESGVTFFVGHARGQSTFDHAHGELFEVLGEAGALGLLATLWGLGVVAWGARRRWREEPARAAVGISLLASTSVLGLAYFPLRLASTGYPVVVLLAWILAPSEVAGARDSGSPASGRGSAGSSRRLALPLVVLAALALLVHGRSTLQRLEANRILRAAETEASTMVSMQRASPVLLRRHRDRLEGALALDPADPRIPLALGSLALLEGSPTRAERWYRRSLEIERRPETLLNLGRSLALQERHEEAQRVFDRVLALDRYLGRQVPERYREARG